MTDKKPPAPDVESWERERPPMTAIMDRLRTTIAVSPVTALRYLTAVTGGWDEQVRQLVIAETCQRAGKASAARDAAAIAVDLATSLPAGSDEDRRIRRLLAMAVHTDVLCWSGDTDAAPACAAYAALAAEAGLAWRVTVAAGLHAVVVYHEISCLDGRTELDDLIAEGSTVTQALPMLTGALNLMRTGCGPDGYEPNPRAWAPLPGGMLQPALTRASQRFLGVRVCRRTGRHRCSRTVPHD